MPRMTSGELLAYELKRNHPPKLSRPSEIPKSTERESAIQDAIDAYLRGLGRPCYFVRHRMDRATTCAVGTPDFVGWINGQAFALEVKRPGCKQTREQAGELLRANLAGARVAVVHSLKEAVDALNAVEGREE